MRFHLILAALFSAVSLRAEIVPVDGYAAVVNDRIITIGDVMSAIQPVEDQLRDAYDGEELARRRQEAFTRGLQALVEEALIVEDFEKQGGQLPDRLVSDRVNEVIHRRFDNDRAAFLAALAEEQITMDEWRENIRDRLIVQVMRRQEVLDKVQVAPASARAYYDTHVEGYRVPEKVELGVIVLNKGQTEEEREVKRQEAVITRGKLLAGSDFAAVARDVSEGLKASEGGAWGWLDPGTLRPELREVVSALKPGELSDVVEAGDAFYIIRLHAREPGRTQSFEEVRDEIDSRLREDETDRLYKEWILRLKQRHYVQVFKSEAN